MTNNVKSNRPVFDAGMALAAQDAKDTSARLTIFRAMQEAGANAESLAKDGEHFVDLRDGYLVAWQGQVFADVFAIANGKVPMKGKILNRQTGAKETVTMPRVKWQQALGSKVSKARDSYLDWIGFDSSSVEESEEEGAKGGAAKKGATKAGQGTARALDKRIADESGKLATATERDRTGGEPSELPHDLFIAAFKAIRAMAEKPERITDEVKESLSRWTDLVK